MLLKSSSSFDLPVRPGRMDMVWSGRVAAKMWSGRVVMVWSGRVAKMWSGRVSWCDELMHSSMSVVHPLHHALH